MYIFEIWNTLIGKINKIGTISQYSEIKNMTISWVNGICVLFTLLILPTLVYLANTTPLLCLAGVPALIFNMLPLYLNHIKRPLLAKLFLIITPTIITITSVILFYPFSWMSLFMVTMQLASFIFLPLVIFTPEEAYYMKLTVGISAFGTLFYGIAAQLIPPLYYDKKTDMLVIFWIVFLSFLLTVIVGIAYYRRLVYEYTFRLLAQQELLQKYNQEMNNQKEKLNTQNAGLTEFNKKLVGSLDMNKDFLQMISHDLKSPVNAILGLTEIIAQEKDLQAIRKYNNYVSHSAQKAIHLIENLRQITMIESGGIDIQKQKIHLDKLIEEVIEQNSIDALKKGQKIEASIEKDFIIELDPIKTYQVVDNILNNAVKYSAKNTTIYIHLHAENNQGVIKIKDSGPGFTPEEKERLFQKFPKLNIRPTGNEISTGLGLFISKKLMELQCGDIEVESYGKNHGSTFIIRFPILTN